MLKLRKVAPTEPLVVTMTGVRMSDRLLVIGGDAPKSVATLALKPGLTGRVCLVDEDQSRITRAAALAEADGALVESATAPLAALPYETGAFDVVLINRALSRLPPERRRDSVAEAARVLRDGGRCVVIEARPTGLAALFRSGSGLPAGEVEGLLAAAGLRAVHVLAEREGLLFAEGAKPS